MTSERLFTLDALRGFAVMGILLMNIVGFALPEAAYVNPMAWGADGPADIVAWGLAFILVDGKMRGLFSLLFGASMLLVIDRAELGGRDGRRVHIVRALWLFAFGVAHYLLLWWGDILMVYAIVGLAALPFVGKTPLALVKWAFAAFAVHFLIVAGFMAGAYALHAAAVQPGASASAIADNAWLATALGQPGSDAILEQVTLYRSGFGTIFAHQLSALPGTLPTLLYFAFDTLGFMLMGMALLKSGFLTGQWSADQYRRTARHCFLIGLPPMIALTAWTVASDFDTLTTYAASLAWSFPFRVPLTIGWAALLLAAIPHFQGHPSLVRIAAAGRMALSNYLGTSILMTAIFYGWGLGLFGKVDRATLYAFALLAWLLMLLWSKPWLDRFAYGPLEWLWRSLARGAVQPVRRISNPD